MSATEPLEEELTEALAPKDAPTDDEIAVWQGDSDGEGAPAAERIARFRVRDLGSADWAGRKIRQAQAKIDEAKAYRARVLAELDAQVAREEARQQPTIEFFEAHLADWLRREIEADTSKKPRASRDLPCGIVVKRTPARPSLVVEDEDALVDWLKDHRPDLVESKMVWKWSKADVKKLADDDGRLALLDEETGEVVEAKGARIDPGEPGWKVDVRGDT